MRGRPAKSKVRNRIAAILQQVNASYGYEVYKRYRLVFGAVNMRTVYYNLRKGVLLNEFIISDIKREVGNYTWGNETERVYYANGPYSKPVQLDEVQIRKLNKLDKKEKMEVSDEQVERIMIELIKDVDDYVLEFRQLPVSTRVHKYGRIERRIDKMKKWTGKSNDELWQKLNTLKNTLKEYEY